MLLVIGVDTPEGAEPFEVIHSAFILRVKALCAVGAHLYS